MSAGGWLGRGCGHFPPARHVVKRYLCALRVLFVRYKIIFLCTRIERVLYRYIRIQCLGDEKCTLISAETFYECAGNFRRIGINARVRYMYNIIYIRVLGRYTHVYHARDHQRVV